MKISRTEARKHAARGEAVILFVAGGFTFAISASAVDEIRSAEGTRRAPEQGSRSVVDVASSVGLTSAQMSRVLVLRRSPVALAVDSLDRMTRMAVLYALPHAFTGDERRWYRGLALIEGNVVPVVNPEAFVSQVGTRKGAASA